MTNKEALALKSRQGMAQYLKDLKLHEMLQLAAENDNGKNLFDLMCMAYSLGKMRGQRQAKKRKGAA